MLLRSASTPILNPLKPHSKETSEIVHQIHKSRPLTLCASSKSLPPHTMIGGPAIRMMRTLSEPDRSNLPVPKRSPSTGMLRPRMAVLDGGLCYDADEGRVGRGGGGGGGEDGGDDGCSGSWDANNDNDMSDLYYQKMIESNPESSLLLTNYARFLKEVRKDLIKAEEYCGRAISVNPNDEEMLSMYADLIWENHKDASRAESYHVQATKISPNNCYVLASYARFLWAAEKDDDVSFGEPCSSSFVFGVDSQVSPLTAAS